MSERIHDVEADTSERVVRQLLAAQCPQWADRPLSSVQASGTSNALWRLQSSDGDVAIRLPRTPGAAESVEMECQLLPVLASAGLPMQVPTVRHRGEPTEAFPHRWAVLGWLDGADAWDERTWLATNHDFAVELAAATSAITGLTNMPVPQRPAGDRGGPLDALLARLDRWLTDPEWAARDHIDVAAVQRLAAESAEVVDEPVTTGFVHGDLIPGNLLTVDAKLAAIIDWGGAGYGDLAQDLAPAWAVFDPPARATFRNALDITDATWLRARAFELEHAVGGIVYYRPRNHLLADVMTQTLNRILNEHL